MFCIYFLDAFVFLLSSFEDFFSYLLFSFILYPVFSVVFCISCCRYSFFCEGSRFCHLLIISNALLVIFVHVLSLYLWG